MRNTVIIIGQVAPYARPLKPWEEVWAVNRSYLLQKPNYPLHRIYFMDPLERVLNREPRFVEDVNGLSDCEIWSQRIYPQINNCREFPLAKIVDHFGLAYFTSTISYMMAHALYYGTYGKIVLHELLKWKCEPCFMAQKACLDFWCGMAMGMGVAVEISDGSLILKPDEGVTALYGFDKG